MRSYVFPVAPLTMLAAAAILGTLPALHASAGITVDQACKQVFQDGKVESGMVNVGKHGFVIKKRKATVERTGDTITVTGYFWHVIAGRNDRVYYTIVVRKGQPYQATVDRIEFGGLFGDGGKLNVGLRWTAKVGGGLAGAIIAENPEGAAPGSAVSEVVENLVLKLANKLQRKLIGNWTPCIPEILDGMAKYFDSQL